jgi:flagellar basal-body rod protein FlgC
MADPISASVSDTTLAVAASALRAEQSRMRVIAENLANSDSVATTPGGDPYQRQVPVFEPTDVQRATGVKMTGVKPDLTPFNIVHDPGNPAADAKGNVKLPNVNALTEAMDMKDAQRAYEASLNVIQTVRSMQAKTLTILTKQGS